MGRRFCGRHCGPGRRQASHSVVASMHSLLPAPALIPLGQYTSSFRVRGVPGGGHAAYLDAGTRRKAKLVFLPARAIVYRFT